MRIFYLCSIRKVLHFKSKRNPFFSGIFIKISNLIIGAHDGLNGFRAFLLYFRVFFKILGAILVDFVEERFGTDTINLITAIKLRQCLMRLINIHFIDSLQQSGTAVCSFFVRMRKLIPAAPHLFAYLVKTILLTSQSKTSLRQRIVLSYLQVSHQCRYLCRSATTIFHHVIDSRFLQVIVCLDVGNDSGRVCFCNLQFFIRGLACFCSCRPFTLQSLTLSFGRCLCRKFILGLIIIERTGITCISVGIFISDKRIKHLRDLIGHVRC